MEPTLPPSSGQLSIQPAIPLAYGRPDLVVARPGGLVLLGVVGLLLAVLSIVTNSLSLNRLPALRAQTSRILAPVVPVLPSPPTVRPYPGDLFTATGWPRPHRQAFVDAIHDPSFSADRQVMLSRLLGEFGSFIDPSSSAVASPLAVDHLPAGPDGLHDLGPTVFRLPAGVIWINDSAAYFQTGPGQRDQVESDSGYRRGRCGEQIRGGGGRRAGFIT